MTLKWSGFSAADFADEFERSATVTRRESKKRLLVGAKKIRDDSKGMAPVDKHNLEDAHKIAVIRLNKNEMGVTIEVGGMMNDRDVDEYAWIMHDTSYKLGPKSQEKNSQAKPNMPVGPKFLERSLELNEEEVILMVAETLPGD